LPNQCILGNMSEFIKSIGYWTIAKKNKTTTLKLVGNKILAIYIFNGKIKQCKMCRTHSMLIVLELHREKSCMTLVFKRSWKRAISAIPPVKQPPISCHPRLLPAFFCMEWITTVIPAIPPPDIPPNSLIVTNLFCMEFFSYIKPLIHMFRHSPRIFYVQSRLIHRGKWIEYRHLRSINQWWSRSRHNMLVDADTRSFKEQRWLETAIYSFVKYIIIY